MKKFLLSGFVVATFIGYSINQKFSSQTEAILSPEVSPLITLSPSFAPAAKKPASGLKDGQYTGPVTDAFYGNVQVKAVISRGKIVDVQFLQYPNDRQTSVYINSQAMPLLKQEAIQAQSANVNGVSGATQTSRAYVQSLQAALSQAQV